MKKRAAKKKEAPKAPKGPNDKTTYDWTVIKTGPDLGKIHCYKDPAGRQLLGDGMWVPELSRFHDEQLARATVEINGILERVNAENQDPDRKASFIVYKNRLMLVWAWYEAVGPEDDEEEIETALGLKAKPRSRGR